MELVTNSVEPVRQDLQSHSHHMRRTHPPTRMRLTSCAERASVDTELRLSSGDEQGYRTHRPRGKLVDHRVARFFLPIPGPASVLFAKWETRKSGGAAALATDWTDGEWKRIRNAAMPASAADDDEEDTWVAIVQFREAAAKLIFGRHFRCSYRVIGLNCNQEMKLVIRGSDAFRVSGKNTLAFGLRHPVTSTIATTRSGTKCWPHCQGLLIFLLHTCQQRP